MLHPSTCPLCSNNKTKLLYSIKGFGIVRCVQCAMVYVNPRFIDQNIFELYRTDYFNNDEYGYSDYEAGSSLRIKTFRRWYRQILPYVDTNSKKIALDVGCATGDFLKLLTSYGWQVQGIELNEGMLNKLKIENLDATDIPLEHCDSLVKFNLITLFDVIEHLPNLHSNIKKLSELLNVDGSIVIVTPNINSIHRKVFGKRWFQFKPKEHINYFSIQTLKKAIHPYGLKIVYSSSSGQYADINFLLRQLGRYGFTFFSKLFTGIAKGIGWRNKNWYIHTGSILVVIKKEK